MTFRDLEYLVALVDHGHFGQAARHCHISQSTLSLQLQKLEKTLGVQLIERTHRRVVITPAGLLLVQRARQILGARQEMLDDAALESGRMPRQMTLGMIPTIAPYRLGPVLAAMQKAYPTTQLRVVEDVTHNLTQAVARGELDAAMLATAVPDSLLEETLLEEDEMLLALAADHPLARKRVMSPADVAKEPLLLLKDGHCLRDQAVGFCTAQQGPSIHHSVAASIETLKALIRAGQGVTLIPRMAVASAEADPSLRYLRMNPAPSRQIRLITRKTSRLGRLMAAVLTRRALHS